MTYQKLAKHPAIQKRSLPNCPEHQSYPVTQQNYSVQSLMRELGHMNDEFHSQGSIKKKLKGKKKSFCLTKLTKIQVGY
jgi:hypothetical protein